MLKLQEISCAYGKVQVLRKVSITVKQGSVVSIIGSNGAGKSTVLRTISGLLHPNQGSIFYKNEDISQAKPEEIVRKGIIHIPEGRMVFPEFTVKENLMMELILVKIQKKFELMQRRCSILFQSFVAVKNS